MRGIVIIIISFKDIISIHTHTIILLFCNAECSPGNVPPVNCETLDEEEEEEEYVPPAAGRKAKSSVQFHFCLPPPFY